jgi:hypothetical protein
MKTFTCFGLLLAIGCSGAEGDVQEDDAIESADCLDSAAGDGDSDTSAGADTGGDAATGGQATVGDAVTGGVTSTGGDSATGGDTATGGRVPLEDPPPVVTCKTGKITCDVWTSDSNLTILKIDGSLIMKGVFVDPKCTMPAAVMDGQVDSIGTPLTEAIYKDSSICFGDYTKVSRVTDLPRGFYIPGPPTAVAIVQQKASSLFIMDARGVCALTTPEELKRVGFTFYMATWADVSAYAPEFCE